MKKPTKKKKPVLTAGELAEHPNPRNPRVISMERLGVLARSIDEFGDLSGVVHNIKTGRNVGGHQRLKVFADHPNAVVEIAKRYPEQTRRGTIAEGWIVLDGERYAYREVCWSEEQETAAMIAANGNGGLWDEPALAQLLAELRDEESTLLQLTGFSPEEIDDMLAAAAERAKVPVSFQAVAGDLATEHKCPSCGHEWSGKAKP